MNALKQENKLLKDNILRMRLESSSNRDCNNNLDLFYKNCINLNEVSELQFVLTNINMGFISADIGEEVSSE